MRNSIIILSLIFICSCSNITITGLYGDCTKHCFVYTKILLKENNEFDYTLFTDVGGERIVKGSWFKSNDTIILNTFEQSKDRIAEVIESTDISDSLKFEIQNDGGYIFLNTSDRYPLNVGYRKIAYTKRFTIEKFKIVLYSDYNMKPIQYIVKNSNTNHFIIKTRELNTNVFLSGKKYIVKRNKLFPINDSTGQTNQLLYLKKRI